ncbi:MAG: LytR/AlgR family response regulator transcription factor [Bacteroidota bacterium]
MKVVIVEDEAFAALRLKKMILDYDPSIVVVAELESVAESVKWFTSNPDPDLIFLDIHLEDDLSFAIFDKVKISSPVIFTTAFDEYAIKAFKLKSIDYLLKPIVQEELIAALKKFEDYAGTRSSSADLQSLYNLLITKDVKYRERFSVSVGNKIKTFTSRDIAYFISEEGYTSACLWDRSRLPLDISLEKLSGEMDPGVFFRINRQMLINIDSIQEIHVYPKSRLKIDVKPKIENGVFVSLDKVTAFKEWIGAKG